MACTLAACLPFVLPGAVRGGDLPAGAESWPTVVDREALTDHEMARFLAANEIAEELRQAAEDRFAADLPRYDTGRGDSRSALSGIDFLRALEGAEQVRAGIEEEACRRAGVPLAEYESIYKRLLQINDLTVLELRIAGVREALAPLAEGDLQARAQEHFRFELQRQRHDLELEKAQIEQWRTRAQQLSEGQEQRERARILYRLRRLPGQEAKLHDRLEKYRAVRDYERGVVNRRTSAVQDAQPLGVVGAVPVLATKPEAAQFGALATEKLDRIDAEITHTEERLAQIAAERHELEAALAELPKAAAPESGESESQYIAQIADLDRQVEQLDAQLATGAGAAEIGPLVSALRSQRVERQQDLARLERQRATPVMQQAQRDRPVAHRHVQDLVAWGTPILIESPATLPR